MEESVLVLEPARRKIANLGALAKSLNEASDAFTEQLKAIELDLRALNLGIAITLPDSIRISDTREDGTPVLQKPVGPARGNREAAFLGYGRVHQDWRLLVDFYDQQWSQNEEGYVDVYNSVLVRQTPLLETTRDVRIAAAPYIDGLLDRMFAETRKKIATLNKALERK